MKYPITDMCELNHTFYRGENHPRKDGRWRCPECMATGLDAARDEIKSQQSQIKQLREALEKISMGEYYGHRYEIREARMDKQLQNACTIAQQAINSIKEVDGE